MKLGYARISIGLDNIDEQMKALEEYGCEKIFTDKDLKNKNGLYDMFAYARTGDIFVVLKLSQLANSLQELEQITTSIVNRGMDFVSIKESIDTTGNNRDLVLHMINVLSDYERELIIERVKSGIKNARDKGIKLGRKSANQGQKEKAYEMYRSRNYTMKEITENTGLSRATIYRYIEHMKAFKEENN